MITIQETERTELLAAAVAAPSIHNTQPWRLRFAGDRVEVYRDRSRELPAEDPDGRMLHLSLGAAVLNVRVAAARLRYGSVCRPVLDPARPDLVAEIELTAAGAETAELAALSGAITDRRTNRNPYEPRRVPDEVRRLLGLAAELEGASLQWVDADRIRLHWLRELTADADLEDRYDPARSSERSRWVGGVRATEGVPSASLGPRAHGRAVVARDLAASPEDSVRAAATFESTPQLAVLSTAKDGPAEWLRAGQAMERVLLEATAHGVATSLLNQAIEHDELRWLVRDPLGAWTRPQAVIRFGYGPAVPPTPRRPLADALLPDEPSTDRTHGPAGDPAAG